MTTQEVAILLVIVERASLIWKVVHVALLSRLVWLQLQQLLTLHQGDHIIITKDVYGVRSVWLLNCCLITVSAIHLLI